MSVVVVGICLGARKRPLPDSRRTGRSIGIVCDLLFLCLVSGVTIAGVFVVSVLSSSSSLDQRLFKKDNGLAVFLFIRASVQFDVLEMAVVGEHLEIRLRGDA